MKCRNNFTHEFCVTTALGTPGRLFTFRERAAKKELMFCSLIKEITFIIPWP